MFTRGYRLAVDIRPSGQMLFHQWTTQASLVCPSGAGGSIIVTSSKVNICQPRMTYPQLTLLIDIKWYFAGLIITLLIQGGCQNCNSHVSVPFKTFFFPREPPAASGTGSRKDIIFKVYTFHRRKLAGYLEPGSKFAFCCRRLWFFPGAAWVIKCPHWTSPNH